MVELVFKTGQVKMYKQHSISHCSHLLHWHLWMHFAFEVQHPNGRMFLKNWVLQKKKAFSAPGRIQSGNMKCWCPKDLVMHYQMKCIFLGKPLSEVSFEKANVCQEKKGHRLWQKEKHILSGVKKNCPSMSISK